MSKKDNIFLLRVVNKFNVCLNVDPNIMSMACNLSYNLHTISSNIAECQHI